MPSHSDRPALTPLGSYPRLPLAIVWLVAIGCGPSVTETAAGEGGSGESTETGTPDPPDGTDVSGVGTSEPSDSTSTGTPPDDGTTTRPQPEGTSTTDATGTTDDTGTPACDMVEQTCILAEQSKIEPVDCGVASLSDGVGAYEMLQDCVVSTAGRQAPFKAVFDQGDGHWQAFVGQVGAVYSLLQLEQDAEFGPAAIVATPCLGLSLVPDCEVDVGGFFASICIQCDGAQRPASRVCTP